MNITMFFIISLLYIGEYWEAPNHIPITDIAPIVKHQKLAGALRPLNNFSEIIGAK